MNKITLYKHQNQLVTKIKKLWRKKFLKILVQSPTGSGKTVIFSFIASQVSERNKKVLIITDRMELLSQAGGTIQSFDMEPYLIQAGTKFIDKTKKVYIGMSQTLRNRISSNKVWRDFIKNEIDLIIIDEAHKQEFNHLFNDDLLKHKFVLGFTATAKRGGKMVQLGLQYDTIVEGKPISWLIKKGYLLNCDIYDCGSPDLSQVKINKAKGDFSESALFKKFDEAKLYKGLVKNYLRLTPNEKMMVFCCNVEHAIKTTKELNKAGVTAKFVCSKKTAPNEPRKWTAANEVIFKEKFKAFKMYEKYFYRYSGDRTKIFKWFKDSKDGVLVNVDVATTGFDDPTVKVIGLYRATMSLVLYLQIIGRGSRIIKGDSDVIKSHFTVLDFGGNKSRFGGYDVDRDWSLWHEESKSEGGVPPMKMCGEDSKGEEIIGAGKVKDGCKRLILAAYKICPFCGFKNPDRKEVKEVDLSLSAITNEGGETIKTKPFRDMNFKELTEYRKIKKHHINWLYRMLWMRDKEHTIRAYAQEYEWKKSRIYYVLEYCTNKF